MTKNPRAFSLVELMVTIAIIGILAAILIATLSGARERAQDAQRMADVETIAKALGMYYVDHRNFLDDESGCGYAGTGNGWFNAGPSENTQYAKSIAQCLIDAGYLTTEIIDPTGGRTPNSAHQSFGYMKYSCVQNGVKTAYIYAGLATKGDRFQDGPANTTCSTGADTNYGMNYWVKI